LARLCRAPGGKTRQLCPGSADVALLLGDALDLWFVSLQRRLDVGRGGRDLAPRCRVRFGAPLLGCGALGVPGLLDGKGRHGFGLRWFAASELTFARPKAPHVAGRALNASVGEQANRPTHIGSATARRWSSSLPAEEAGKHCKPLSPTGTDCREARERHPTAWFELLRQSRPDRRGGSCRGPNGHFRPVWRNGAR